MNTTEKEISYQSTNSYSTLNSFNQKTTNVWLVCHGMGYLSRFFLRYFKALNPVDNFLIAPQAQGKYYMPPKFKHVGANWLTRENTLQESENVMRYFDAIWKAEQIPDHINLIVLGYSQGVSVSMRWVASRKIRCHQLVIMSGGIPKELTSEDFSFLKDVRVTHVYGTEDQYLDDDRITYETNRSKELFGNKVTIIPFEGPHEVRVNIINDLV